MSLFFEDLEVKVEAESAPVIVEDTTGLLSITLESEMAWHNLETAMMKEEFKAVIKEDEEGLQKSKGQFFKNIIAWFEKIWKAIVAGIQNLITKLVVQFRNGEKFLASKKGALEAYKGGKSAEIYAWKIGTMAGINSQFPDGIGQKLKGMIATTSTNGVSADDVAKQLGYSSFADIDKQIVGKAHDNSRTSKEISTAWIGSAEADIKSAKTVIGKLKKFAGDARNLVAEGKKAAQEGMKAVEAGKETIQKIKTANAMTAKSATTVLNKIINVYVKLQLERYADSLRIIKAVVGGAKSDEKELKKNKNLVDQQKAKQEKEDKKKVKNDAFDLLSLEDFEDDENDLDLTGDGIEDDDPDDLDLEDLDLDLEDLDTEE